MTITTKEAETNLSSPLFCAGDRVKHVRFGTIAEIKKAAHGDYQFVFESDRTKRRYCHFAILEANYTLLPPARKGLKGRRS